MGGKDLQSPAVEAWDLVRRQHGIVTRSQLLALGLTRKAIQHRIERGRLHPLWRGVYAAGRPEITRRGRWMAAVLACGPAALLSHRSAASLWGLVRDDAGPEVVVPYEACRRRAGIRVHRRVDLASERRKAIDGIPVTDLVSTLIDVAACLRLPQTERAVNEADRLGLIDPESLRLAVEKAPHRPGRGRLLSMLEVDTFALTDSELEGRFLRLVRRAGLPSPRTQAWLNGFRVDFHWPDLGLVVETDGLRYHRTPGQQKRDRHRDQTHAVAGLTTLHFTAAQVRFEPDEVVAVLSAVIERLRGNA
jgi:very-short-patch-repair endonuclease